MNKLEFINYGSMIVNKIDGKKMTKTKKNLKLKDMDKRASQRMELFAPKERSRV